MPVSISSADRDRDVYPDPSHYVAHMPFPIQNVGGIALGSLEMPSIKTQFTIEEDVNDRFTFSEGLRIDLGETTHTVQSSTMFNNQIMIKEGINKYVVSVPSYLAQITGIGGSNEVVTTDTASSGYSQSATAWYTCYVDWQALQPSPKPPTLKAICGGKGYMQEISSTGTLANPTVDASSFVGGFVHLDALSVQEICSYLTYAFANYTTYAMSPFVPTANKYTFEYHLGKVRVRSSGSNLNPSLHFPTNTNTNTASQTAFYGSQNNGFTDRMQLNASSSSITSLGYMLGLANNATLTTKTYIYKSNQRTCLGFHTSTEPRFLFEARLRPGMYTQSSLATNLPIAMNPLHFTSSLNPTTTGTCYFGFVDSAGNERLVIINQGKYTPETFCQALEYALNRLDENGPYPSTNRFTYKGVGLTHEIDHPMPDITLDDTVVYNVRYDFDTSKFHLENAWASAVKPFDPSTATTLDTTKPAPPFSLLFDPTTLARIAPQVENLSTLCAAANVDRVANVLGFHMQDYHGKSTYTSDFASHIPRIPFPLSQGFPPADDRRLFRDQSPEDLGIGQSDTTSCGTPTYMYPRGRYRAVGFVPTRQNLNLNTGAAYAHESTTAILASTPTSSPATSVAIANKGFSASDYTLSPPSTAGAFLAPSQYLIIDNSAVGAHPSSTTIIQVDSVVQSTAQGMASGTVVDVGTGAITTPRDFVPIAAHDNVRIHSVTNVSPGSSERCMLVSTHSNAHGTNGEAFMTTTPFGFQLGDVVNVKCVSDALTNGTTTGLLITLSAVLGPDQGLVLGTTLPIIAGTAVENEYHLVLGGNHNAIVKVSTAGGSGTGRVEVVESGSGYFPSSSLALSYPILHQEFQAVVVQQANSGGHFHDSDNSQREQFFTCLPYLGSSITSCVAAKTVDGACVRLRIPTTLNQTSVSGVPLSGNVQRIAELAPPRVDVHIEDDNMHTRIKPIHAQTVLGTGRHNLTMDSTLSFPSAMNVDPVHYVMVKFLGLNNRRNEQVHYTNGTTLRDVAGKVILGAPTTLVRSLVTQIEFAPTTLTQVEVAFYLPDGKTKYNFHGLDHTLTLNMSIKDRSRPHNPATSCPSSKRKFQQSYC